MPGIVRMQSFARSRLDRAQLISFDREVIEKSTAPLIHREARYWFITRGRGTLRLQNSSFALFPGTLVSVLPWQVTEITEVTEPLQFGLIVYHLDTLTRLMKSFYDETELAAGFVGLSARAPVQRLNKKEAAAVERVFSALFEELGMESTLAEPVNRPFARVLAMNRLVELAVLFSRKALTSAQPIAAAEPVPDRSEILRYLYMHCGEKLTLSRLSRIFYIGENSISAYVTGLTGLSFSDLVNEMRIGKTVNYLLYTDLTIEELSHILGYVDASHISKVFSARVGTKIGAFRNTYCRVGSILREDDSRRAYQVVEYVRRNHAKPLSAAAVSAEFGLTAAQLERILVCQVEKNFEEFLHCIRVQRACELLADTDRSVMDIALSVGYNTQKTLTRNFLRLMVATPQSYRKRARADTRRLAAPPAAAAAAERADEGP